ncbi:hypothetical protein CF319_g8865 [Tilletia indica]|nr:hypothetical protein CF319_g8865 [Tilletia indica]
MLGRLAPDIFVQDEEGTFLHGGARWRLDEGRANSVMRKEQRFLRSLFAAIFFDAGPANRGTELASTIIKNTADQTRDVVIGPGGAVIFDTAHSKSAWKGIYVDKVSRVLPKKLGTALIRYLLAVRPTMDQLRFLLFGSASPAHLFICPNGTPWPSDSLGETVRASTQRNGLGVPLGLLGVRHCQAAICFRMMELATLKKFITIHTAEEKKTRASIEDGDEVAGGQDPFFGDLGGALHAQSNHSLTTASIHYHDDVAVRQGLGMDRQVSAILASAAWHKILGLESVVGFRHQASISQASIPQAPTATVQAATPQAPTATVQAAIPQAPTAPAQPAPLLPSKNTALSHDTLSIMAELLRRSPRAKSRGQAIALNRLARTQESFLAVLPTGAGKSLLWQIGARLAGRKGQILVLLVSLLALRDEAVRVAEEIGLKVWSDTRSRTAQDIPRDTEVVIFSLDFALGQSGSELLHDLAAQRRLGRVCIDEAHSLFHDVWRVSMTMGWKLSLLDTPLLLLSATVPPSRVSTLAAAVKLDHLSQVRESVQQLSISFSIEIIDDDHPGILSSASHPVNERIIELASEKVAQGKPVMVFARERAQAKALSRVLGCVPFLGVKGGGDEKDGDGYTREEMDATLKAFVQGKTDLVCGTMAMSLGLNRQDIQSILCAGIPFSLIDLVQQAGRCGRDGQPSDVKVVIIKSTLDSLRRDKQARFDLEKACLESFLVGDTCRRTSMGRLFDEYVQSCFELPGAEFCDVCGEVERSFGYGDLRQGQEEQHGEQQEEQRQEERQEQPEDSSTTLFDQPIPSSPIPEEMLLPSAKRQRISAPSSFPSSSPISPAKPAFMASSPISPVNPAFMIKSSPGLSLLSQQQLPFLELKQLLRRVLLPFLELKQLLSRVLLPFLELKQLLSRLVLLFLELKHPLSRLALLFLELKQLLSRLVLLPFLELKHHPRETSFRQLHPFQHHPRETSFRQLRPSHQRSSRRHLLL